ncbi:MAG: hypothetical protein V2I34_07245 [Bacteroidales bacterium]|jgi:hypothetical protein|nr:hypothetical protein [Bacteroidales bacterium]
MKIILSTAFIILLSCLLMFSCRQKEAGEVIPATTFSTYSADSLQTATEKEKHEIFYGLLTPVEISAIFNRMDAAINIELLNPVSRAGDYMSASKAALNLGIYGMDMSYLKLHNMNAEMLSYMMAVRELSKRLNIPTEYLTDPLERIENNMSDTDTVLALMNSSYKKIEDHLGESDRESTAGLIVLGGWIEALYLSTQLLLDPDNPDPEVVQRIAEQKYTLNTLLSFLKNYYDDPVVVYYTKKLKFLKKYFDRFDILFEKNDLEIDYRKQVLRASGSDMTITRQTLRDIKDYARKMRQETVSM